MQNIGSFFEMKICFECLYVLHITNLKARLTYFYWKTLPIFDL